jgi:hypothetical protein
MDVDAATPPPLPRGATTGPKDYVTEEALPRILELIEESWRRSGRRRLSCSSMPSPPTMSSRPPPSTPPPPTGM